MPRQRLTRLDVPARFAAAIFLVLLTACPAAAGSRPDAWISVSTADFELYTTAGERSGRNLMQQFQRVRAFFSQAFGAQPAAGRPVRIVAFRDEKQYRQYRPTDVAAAFYQPGTRHDFIVLSGASADLYPVAIHEYTHLLIHQTGLKLPQWLNEGLAELYSTLEPQGEKVLIGRPGPGRVEMLRSARWIPLATLLTANRESAEYHDRDRAGMFYAESWALVHMLTLDPSWQGGIKALASALQSEPPDAAFARVYHQPLDAVESALRKYLAQTTVSARLVDARLSGKPEAPTIDPNASLAARVALAELLGYTRGRDAEAHTAYDALLKESPDRWDVEEGAGELAWRARDLEAAARHLGRAIDLGCPSQSSWLLQARILGYLRRWEAAVALLERAAARFAPDPEFQLELGAALVGHGDYARAEESLAPLPDSAAARTFSGDETYRLFYNLAYARYRLGKLEPAHSDLARARAATRNPEQLATLNRLAAAFERAAHASTASSQAEGMVESLECGSPARLHVRVDGRDTIFLLPDPTHAGVDLICGPQNPPRRIRIEYQPLPASPDVAGVVRVLRFP